MGKWERRRLLFAACRHLRAGRDAPEVLARLRALASTDLQDLQVALAAAELLKVRASRTEGANTADLAEAINLYRHCASLAPPGHRDRAGVFHNLGQALYLASSDRRFPGAAAQAVHAFREALAAAPCGDSTRPLYLFSLAAGLSRCFEESGDQEALEEAVRVAREGSAAAATGSSDRARCWLMLLSALTSLADATERPEPLHEAVELARQALSEARSSAARADARAGLAVSLKRLYTATRETQLLVEAVEAAAKCCDATPRSHPDRGLRRELFAGTVRDLADDTRDPDLMRQAVTLMKVSVNATPKGPDLVDGLINLSRALLKLHAMTDAQDAMRDAERAARAAVAVAPYGTSHSVAACFVLAEVLLLRHRDAAEALEEALTLTRAGIAATPRDDADRASRLLLLGLVLHSLHVSSGGIERLHGARDAFAEAASAPAPASTRLAALKALASVETARGDRRAALAASEAAVTMLPQLTADWMPYGAVVHRLADIAGLPADAASAALDAGSPGRALELLELSRGVLHGRALDIRGDLRALRRQSPEFHDEFVRLQEDANAGIQDEVWDKLLARIRGLAGMERFLLPPSAHDLRQCASRGPVVVVNVSERRCDALILRADAGDPVHAIPLPMLTQADMYQQLLRLLKAETGAADAHSLHARRQCQRDLHDILGWLWDCVAAPVLEELGFSGRPETDAWPRIWWCPVGEMAYFPLHAAGYHDTGSAESVMDRVVSSYTTTVRALRPAADDRPGTSAPVGNPGVVVVAMPVTEEAPALPCVLAEINALTTLMPGTTVLSGAEATSDRVLKALARHGVAHLSCHGITDVIAPAASRLLLHDHLTRPLTVEQISNLELLHAEMAYLSACDTSMPNIKATDEALHITAALQLAGYRHVIGTLWSVNDVTAADITRATYARLTTNGTTAPRTDESADALHQTVRELRDRYPASPTLWAGHIHVGP
ncbi:CHAT domain-containing protein [Streptomyces regalis]|uniref:CHAT domain-containing protein n=1 Tax=Streptomyces regalis TaxID=68262 RepID=A0A117MJV3_9ACTN|nr:CHAT domain-containing protein [Streptomyces regalis]KUL21386.1 hypothetical protein ADL12_44985 [Streptomyces regalis]